MGQTDEHDVRLAEGLVLRREPARDDSPAAHRLPGQHRVEHVAEGIGPEDGDDEGSGRPFRVVRPLDVVRELEEERRLDRVFAGPLAGGATRSGKDEEDEEDDPERGGGARDHLQSAAVSFNTRATVCTSFWGE